MKTAQEIDAEQEEKEPKQTTATPNEAFEPANFYEIDNDDLDITF